MSKKHKNISITLNCIEQYFILASAITGCVLICAFASLVGIPIGVTSSAGGFKIYVITAAIKSINQ